jgi:type IV pilus assembly protein PilW
MNHFPSSTRQSGLTLIELMISLLLGLLLTLAVTSLFIGSNRSFRENEQLAAMQDQARFALAALSRDFSMSGYWGGVFSGTDLVAAPSASEALPAAIDCGAPEESWAFRTDRRIEFRNQDSDIAVASRFHCLDAVMPDSDIVGLRRVSGQMAVSSIDCTAVKLLPWHFYLKTNGTVGSLIRTPASGSYDPCVGEAPTAPGSQYYRYIARLYYVRDYARQPGDGVPSLCRRELRHEASPGMADECLADGIENLQVVFGIDTNGDGVADRYDPTPADDALQQAISVQISVLVRTQRGFPQYRDEKTYQMGDWNYTPSEVEEDEDLPAARRAVHHYRRVFSTQVQLRNAALQ